METVLACAFDMRFAMRDQSRRNLVGEQGPTACEQYAVCCR